jgi:hypothetical protein
LQYTLLVAVLARVTGDPDEPRGPDVLHTIDVPSEWLELGLSIEVTLPRLLPCARCAGGGCDGCSRKGAFEQPTSGVPGQVVVTLPTSQGGASGALCLRLPGSGARHATDSALPLGHLLLTIVPRAPTEGWLPASSLRALDALDEGLELEIQEPASPEDEKIRRLAARIRAVQARAAALFPPRSRLPLMWGLGIALISLLAWWLLT